MNQLIATLLAKPLPKNIAALFIIFEIYNLGVIPAWHGTLELQTLKAQLETTTQQAINAQQRQTSEASALAETAKIKLAEAHAAALQEKALADKTEQEAVIAEQTALPSPERQRAEADKMRSEAQIQFGRAEAAAAQAKADADIAEQQAQQEKADMQLATESADAEIALLKSTLATKLENLKLFIGSPLPDLD